ncbi:hypothetical protein C7I87_28130 [Mesorhizobium sp. SARCC-RB16n]|uniref:hypothetical protein n=1 Tax=Mesorhizobium sp. SARCC-RB16n TaxID=2116687 RepID=UPI00122EF51D|nr:hypothetical protein [Mesorhizobium sp. SARCC-RB16n]KAA3447128.1 hypothetical protein C7I87_28130 [Mesorhizobium sp. SARCC-RB16n]
MQVVISLDELAEWHTWCRNFKAEHAGKPGADFVENWSVPVPNGGGRRFSSELQVLHMQLPSSLGLASFNAYRRKQGLEEIDPDTA